MNCPGGGGGVEFSKFLEYKYVLTLIEMFNNISKITHNRLILSDFCFKLNSVLHLLAL